MERMSKMAKNEVIEITCRVISIPFSKPSQYAEGKHWCVILTDQGKITGEIELGSVLTGCDYRVGGHWEENAHGKSFKFKSIAIREPSTRNGVVNYLGKYVPHVGAATAGKLCDKFGADKCVGILRDSPEAVFAASINGMTMERCVAASDALKGLSKFEDTRIELMDIFAGRRLRQVLPDMCIKKWGSAAAKVVRENAFVLIEEGFPGCGFLLVDELYLSLGGHPTDMRRQVYALEYVLQNLSDNSTWGSRSLVLTEIGKICSKGMQFAECVNAACEQGKVRVRTEGGEMFLACKKYADIEVMIAERLWDIAGDELLVNTSAPVAPERASLNQPVTMPNPLDDVFRVDRRERTSPIQIKQDDEGDDLAFDLDATDADSEDNYEEASELVEILDGLLEDISDIDAAQDYYESVSEKLAPISEQIEKRKSATAKQISALVNMISGCERWVEGASKGREWE